MQCNRDQSRNRIELVLVSVQTRKDLLLWLLIVQLEHMGLLESMKAVAVVSIRLSYVVDIQYVESILTLTENTAPPQ